jgi:sugar phosphate isomerase/epimerase
MTRTRIHHLPALLALAVLAGGCARGDEQQSAAADASSDTATQVASAAADSSGFDFQGDFKGPLGIQLWSVRDSMAKDVPGTLKQVHDWGFREVELAGTYGQTPAQFRQALDSAGIRATSMHVDFNRLRDSTSAAIADAKTLGVQYIGTAWLPHEGDFTTAMARQFAADFNRIGRAARDQGLVFFYHTHGYEFKPAAGDTIPFDLLVSQSNPDDVKYEMDVFWVTRPGQDPTALLKKYPDRWIALHVKDMKKGTPTNDFSGGAPATAEVAVGSGQIDYRSVLATAPQVGVKKDYIEDETTDPFGNIPKSIGWMETVKY